MRRLWADHEVRGAEGAWPGRRWRRVAVAVTAVALPVAVCGATAAPGMASTTSYAVTATILVGDTPLGVGVDPPAGTVYVADNGDSAVSVIDGATGTVTATIPVGTEPIGVGVDPSAHTAYVANFDDSTVSAISPSVPDTDLALSQPANITTHSTRPKGATVTYPLPSVSDEDATTPAPICSPAPGTVFPFGTTTVTCSVTDADDSPSTVTVTFTVTLRHGHPRR